MLITLKKAEKFQIVDGAGGSKDPAAGPEDGFPAERLCFPGGYFFGQISRNNLTKRENAFIIFLK